jgi:hypothetical protein
MSKKLTVEELDKLKAFVNGWLVEIAFGVFDREDLPRLADKLLIQLEPLFASATKEAVKDTVYNALNVEAWSDLDGRTFEVKQLRNQIWGIFEAALTPNDTEKNND